MKYLPILIIILFFVSCKEPQARKPVTVKSGSYMQSSIDRTKKIMQLENEAIELYIKNDSTNTYLNSGKGFKYAYIKKDTLNTYTPNFGDQILYTYSVSNLNNNLIYSTNEIGDKTYFIDQKAEIIEGFRQGLKIIKVGEEIKFIFPSQLAYGYSGDRKKIDINTPIICTVSLKGLKPKKN